jgi:hypothetical protein
MVFVTSVQNLFITLNPSLSSSLAFFGKAAAEKVLT